MNINTPINYLIERCIEGNRKAQKEMYDLFASKMFTICLKYSKSRMDAEDALQEGFIKLFNKLSKYRGEGSFEGWVRRIFVNNTIDLIRTKNEHSTLNETYENTFISDTTCALNNLYEKDIMKTSEALSDGYKTVFTMYAIEGFSHKEIAHKLGISESTSKSQFSRAKAVLRDLLKVNFPGRQKLAV